MKQLTFVLALAAAVAGCQDERVGGDPEHFSGTGTECGRYQLSIDRAVPEEATSAQECLAEALAAGTPAFLGVIADTDEGHPFRIGYQVDSDSVVVIEIDWNGDPLGPDGLERKRCTGLTPGAEGVPTEAGRVPVP